MLIRSIPLSSPPWAKAPSPLSVQNGGGDAHTADFGGYSQVSRGANGAALSHRRGRGGTASRGLCSPGPSRSSVTSTRGDRDQTDAPEVPRRCSSVPPLVPPLPGSPPDAHPLALGIPRCHAPAVSVGGGTGVFIPIKWVTRLGPGPSDPQRHGPEQGASHLWGPLKILRAKVILGPSHQNPEGGLQHPKFYLLPGFEFHL